MKYVIKVTGCFKGLKFYTNLKKAILYQNLNYGTFQNWKSKNKIDYPFTYKEYHFEKVEVK